MALTNTSRNAGRHFWTRAAGLTGLLLLGAGLLICLEAPGAAGIALAVVGGGLAVLALVFEVRGAMGMIASRRAALGSNVVLQIALAILLLAGVNAYSFFHHQRFDWTRDRVFTIPADVQRDLAQLRGETRIVVYQPHTSFGQLAAKPDNYDAAAERKIVEKVKDLVEQFQELGPRFRVEVLDIQDESFQDKVAAIKKEMPALAEAIDRAPENSIFFYANGKVQRLGFHDIYQLDKESSRQANGGQGNLVLRDQGIEPFARKILAIDERRPRVAVAVIHSVLGLQGEDEDPRLTMAGARKALTSRDFDSRDIILKKWSETAPPEAAVLTYDENRYQKLEQALADLDATIKDAQNEIKELSADLKFWKTSSVEELNKKYAIVLTEDGGGLLERSKLEKLKGTPHKVVPLADVHRQQMVRNLEPQLAIFELNLQQADQERQAVYDEQKKLNVEDLAELRRITDVKAKMTKVLSDTDLLIVPRLTLVNIPRGLSIPNRVHQLDPVQLDAIKDFMKAGKPVLFCLGPTNEDPDPRRGGNPLEAFNRDPLEGLLGALGVKMPKQTILFNVETKSFAERRQGLLIEGTPVEVPPVIFDWPAGAGFPGTLLAPKAREPNPIRTSLRLASRSVGKDQALDLRLHYPRPIYYESPLGGRLTMDPTFMMTSAESWNEDQPFPTRERAVPRFERKGDDPHKGTIEERRRGPFPIGIAVEAPLPASWYEGARGEIDPAKVRLAVIGSGQVFTGTTLNAANEKVLLDVSNWLLGRNELLAHDTREPWQYPRVALSESASGLWKWATILGMPLLFVYLGFMVLMVRRMR